MVQPTGRRFTSAAAANCYYNYLAQAPNRDNKRTYLSDLHLSQCKCTAFNLVTLIFPDFFALKLIFCRNFAAEIENGPVRGLKRSHQTGPFVRRKDSYTNIHKLKS